MQLKLKLEKVKSFPDVLGQFASDMLPAGDHLIGVGLARCGDIRANV